jgi:hypothetical protein
MHTNVLNTKEVKLGEALPVNLYVIRYSGM